MTGIEPRIFLVKVEAFCILTVKCLLCCVFVITLYVLDYDFPRGILTI